MTESKLWIAHLSTGKRCKVLAKTREEVDQFFPVAPEKVDLAFQPDPKVFRVYDKIGGWLYDHRTLTCRLGRRFVPAPHIDLRKVRAFFVSSRRFGSLYSMRIWGIGPAGESVFHILTDEFKDRGTPNNEAKELLQWITGDEDPFCYRQVYGDETRVSRRKDLHNRDSQTGRNCLDDMKDDTGSFKAKLFNYKNLRFTLS